MKLQNILPKNNDRILASILNTFMKEVDSHHHSENTSFNYGQLICLSKAFLWLSSNTSGKWYDITLKQITTSSLTNKHNHYCMSFDNT
jgi:hypothetical protein